MDENTVADVLRELWEKCLPPKRKTDQKRKKSLIECKKCSGKGWYMYDEIHGQPCEACCSHSLGWWKLKKHYSKDNGKYACEAGCGTIISRLPQK